MAGTLLRGGPSLLARNEHLPCETVVRKLFCFLFCFFHSSHQITGHFHKKKKRCSNCSQQPFGVNAPDGENEFRVTWQGDWLMATLASLTGINLPTPYFFFSLCVLMKASYVLRG